MSWTKEQTAEFKRLFPHFDDAELAAFFRISAETIDVLAKALDLSKSEVFITLKLAINGRSTPLNMEDLQAIPMAKNQPVPSDRPAPPPPKSKETAQKGNKSTQKPNKWTIKDDEILRAEYPNTSSAELAKHLGRTQRAVELRASALGIRKRQNKLSEKREPPPEPDPDPEPEQEQPPEVEAEDDTEDDTDDYTDNIQALSLDPQRVETAKARKILKEMKKRDAEKIPVRIDAKTTILIKPGDDPERAKAEYLKKHFKK